MITALSKIIPSDDLFLWPRTLMCSYSFFRYLLELILTIYRCAFLNLSMELHAYSVSLLSVYAGTSHFQLRSSYIRWTSIYRQCIQLKVKWYYTCVESIVWRVYAVIQWARYLIIDANLHSALLYFVNAISADYSRTVLMHLLIYAFTVCLK